VVVVVDLARVEVARAEEEEGARGAGLEGGEFLAAEDQLAFVDRLVAEGPARGGGPEVLAENPVDALHRPRRDHLRGAAGQRLLAVLEEEADLAGEVGSVSWSDKASVWAPVRSMLTSSPPRSTSSAVESATRFADMGRRRATQP
jgi:hypothetical protein